MLEVTNGPLRAFILFVAFAIHWADWFVNVSTADWWRIQIEQRTPKRSWMRSPFLAWSISAAWVIIFTFAALNLYYLIVRYQYDLPGFAYDGPIALKTQDESGEDYSDLLQLWTAAVITHALFVFGVKLWPLRIFREHRIVAIISTLYVAATASAALVAHSLLYVAPSDSVPYGHALIAGWALTATFMWIALIFDVLFHLAGPILPFSDGILRASRPGAVPLVESNRNGSK